VIFNVLKLELARMMMMRDEAPMNQVMTHIETVTPVFVMG
jgi:hypothetical protein